MNKSLGNKNSGFWKSVKERAQSKKAEEEEKKQQVAYLDKDCISNILVRLPLESLQSCIFVCKPWHSIIKSPIFIESHLTRSESVLIFLKPFPNENSHPSSSSTPKKCNNFSVEESFSQSEPVPILWGPTTKRTPKFSIEFLKFGDGRIETGEYNITCRGNIRATCDGLILLENKNIKKGGLVVINPVTRKLLALPLGTIYPPQDESYGFTFTKTTRRYKVVHLFRDELGYVSCEILDIGTRFWRPVNGPAFGVLGWFGHRPISAVGSLHWIPQIDDSDYIVCFEVERETFRTKTLPKSCGTYDRIVEMGGLLGFVRHEGLKIEIWKLGSLSDGWMKEYSICSGSVIDMVPVLSRRIRGDLVFKREEDGSFYAYDFKLHEMRKVEADNKGMRLSNMYLPHVNRLVSWMYS